MDFIYKKYTRKPLSSRYPKTRLSLLKKAIKALQARKIKGLETSVHFMDKTDILFENTESFSFFPVNHT